MCDSFANETFCKSQIGALNMNATAARLGYGTVVYTAMSNDLSWATPPSFACHYKAMHLSGNGGYHGIRVQFDATQGQCKPNLRASTGL